MNYNENPSHSNKVNETVLFLRQIRTKQRYVWTKREFTEEGSALGELVDQVSFLSVDEWYLDFNSCVFCLCSLEMWFILPPKTFSSLCGIFLFVTHFLLAHQFPHMGH